jgi:hypothetical protein
LCLAEPKKHQRRDEKANRFFTNNYRTCLYVWLCNHSG